MLSMIGESCQEAMLTLRVSTDSGLWQAITLDNIFYRLSGKQQGIGAGGRTEEARTLIDRVWPAGLGWQSRAARRASASAAGRTEALSSERGWPVTQNNAGTCRISSDQRLMGRLVG
jgi:hypothetical protein